MSKQRFTKIISDRFSVPKRRGGGIVKIEVWENEDGAVVKYSFAYINHMLCSKDNGRVIGYDNTHNYHHKHYFGDIFPVDDFTDYESLLNQFEEEIKEFIR